MEEEEEEQEQEQEQEEEEEQEELPVLVVGCKSRLFAENFSIFHSNPA